MQNKPKQTTRENHTPSRPSALFSLLRMLGGDSGDWVLLGLGFLLGGLAFLWAGYLGRPGYLAQPRDPNPLLGHPWSLFGYFCLVMIVLEASILLDKRWKPSQTRITTTLAVTVGCIAVVSGVYLIGKDRLAQWISDILPQLEPIGRWIGANKQVAFVAANLVLVIILWLGIRFATYDPEAAANGQRPAFRGERFAGDLLLSTCFSVILAFAFFGPFWQSGTALAAANQHGHGAPRASLTVCHLTFLPYKSPCNLSPFDFSTLFMANLIILPLCYLFVTLVILSLEAWHQALERGRAEEFPTAFLEVARDVISRNLTLPNLLLALRYIWPFLILAATVLAGIASVSAAKYLYAIAVASKGRIFWLDLSLPTLGLQFGAILAVGVAMVATISATTLQVFPRSRVSSGLRHELAFTWRHIRFFALMLAVSYWVFSLLFSIINGLALIVVREVEIVSDTTLPDYHWAPFIQPDPLMLLSLAVFIFYAVRQARRRARAKTTVGATSASHAA